MRRYRGAAPALLALLAAASAAAGARPGDGTETRPLPFLSDDYGRALADARARSLPLFIEAWAPW
ncbi:MAG TPA: hypothetical protein VEQ10_02705 [Vicinamibacteria bacterium]|nr:hypothetical protein [Vicinamibacteria bacterium]